MCFLLTFQIPNFGSLDYFLVTHGTLHVISDLTLHSLLISNLKMDARIIKVKDKNSVLLKTKYTVLKIQQYYAQSVFNLVHLLTAHGATPVNYKYYISREALFHFRGEEMDKVAIHHLQQMNQPMQ